MEIAGFEMHSWRMPTLIRTVLDIAVFDWNDAILFCYYSLTNQS